MNDGPTSTVNSFWNKNFVAFNQLEYPNFDNSALLFGYELINHYFIPNDFTKKGEYDLYIYAEDNATPKSARKSTCTQNLLQPVSKTASNYKTSAYGQNEKYGKQILHVCGPTSSVITEQPEDLMTSYTWSAAYPSRYSISGHNVNLVGQTVLPYIYKKEIFLFSLNPDHDKDGAGNTNLWNWFPYRDMDNTDHPYC
jgi:hypothetical protein